MRPLLHLSLTAVAGATAAVLAASPPAHAADAVYGGTTRAQDPIVLKAKPDASELRSLVISWAADCSDGRRYPSGTALTAVKPTAGFAPSGTELLVSQNARGRFKGVRLAASDLGDAYAAIQVEVAGTLKRTRATGTLTATVKIADKATGNAITSCQANLRWTASRIPQVIYAGATSQGQPVVVRLDDERTRVNNLLMTWTASCQPSGGFLRIPESFTGFPVKRTGAFGNPMNNEYALDGGGKQRFDYALSGRVSKTAVKGKLQVKVAETDAAGAPTDACDSGGLTFTAATG